MPDMPKKSKMQQLSQGYADWRDTPMQLSDVMPSTTTTTMPQNTPPETAQDVAARDARFKAAINSIQSNQPSLKDVQNKQQQDMQDEMDYLDSAQQFSTDPTEKAAMAARYQRIKQMLGK